MPGKGRPFEEGNQASKGHGRPPGSGHVDICQTYANEKGWQKLIDLAEGFALKTNVAGETFRAVVNDELAYDALKTILAYGFGKPPSKVDLSSGGVTLFDWLKTQFRPGLGDGRGSKGA